VFIIFYGILKLNSFLKPKVGPIGDGLSESQIKLIWALFTINMLIGVVGIILFIYLLMRKK